MGLRGLMVVGALIFSFGCGGKTVKTTPDSKWEQPDSSGVLRLFTKERFAQGCPVEPTLLLTARHVAVREHSTTSGGPVQVIWSDHAGNSGSAWAEDYDYRRDLASMRSDAAFKTVYKVAAESPEVGERVVIVGYNLTNALAPKIVTVKVLRQVSGHLVLSEGGERGFSGSCVLNGKGEVVGIFTWLVRHDMHIYGVAPLVTGPWRSIAWKPQE